MLKQVKIVTITDSKYGRSSQWITDGLVDVDKIMSIRDNDHSTCEIPTCLVILHNGEQMTVRGNHTQFLPETKADQPRPMTTFDGTRTVRQYLEETITYWRNSDDPMAHYYVDAYQSVYASLFGVTFWEW